MLLLNWPYSILDVPLAFFKHLLVRLEQLLDFSIKGDLASCHQVVYIRQLQTPFGRPHSPHRVSLFALLDEHDAAVPPIWLPLSVVLGPYEPALLLTGLERPLPQFLSLDATYKQLLWAFSFRCFSLLQHQVGCVLLPKFHFK